MIITFVNILAWIGAIGGTAITVLLCIASHYYNKEDSREKLNDMLHGVRREFLVGRYLVTAIVCWVWLIAGWIS